MLVPLTLRLIALPERAWDDFSSACSEGAIPAALLHGGAVATFSVFATVFGSALLPGATVSRVVVQALGACAAYFGAVLLVSRLPATVAAVPASESDLVPRFAVTAALPLVATGWLSLVPLLPLAFLWTAAGAFVAYRSALSGAQSMLRLGPAAARTLAPKVVGRALVPILAGLAFRLAISR